MNISVTLVPDIPKIRAACSQAEIILAVQILKDTKPYVPARGSVFFKLARTDGNYLIYPGPMARYLYYGKRMVNAATGNGPHYIEDVGYRWPKKAKLRATNDDLHYTTAIHAKAGPKWVERSMVDNRDKWKRVAERAVAAYGR